MKHISYLVFFFFPKNKIIEKKPNYTQNLKFHQKKREQNRDS